GLVWRSDPAALQRIMSGRMPAEDRWDALASIVCPTLVVRGTHSNVLSEDIARQMVQTLADGRLMELDAGHNVPLDRPRELADAVVVLGTCRLASLLLRSRSLLYRAGSCAGSVGLGRPRRLRDLCR